MDIDAIREFCLGLPVTTEDVKWEDSLCFLVAGKMFAMLSLSDHGRLCIKVPAQDFDELCSQEGVIPAPYLARAKWILITNQREHHVRWIKALLEGSYELIRAKLSRKLKLEYGLGEA